MQQVVQDLQSRLVDFGQDHVLRYWGQFDLTQQEELVHQLSSIDFEQLRRLRDHGASETDFSALALKATPPKAFRINEVGEISSSDARLEGQRLLASGGVGAVLVAGGQGTRLGFPHPKGMFPVGPVSERSLFQMHVDQLLAISRRYGHSVPLYLMTSPATHDETVAYFQQHDRLGLAEDDLHIFCQGTMPTIDDRGRLMLESRHRVCVNPDGHGGMLDAFDRSGCLQHAQSRGIDQLFYFQVDNPLVSVCDAEFLGYHSLAQSDMSTSVVAKNTPLDPVGNVVSIDDSLQVIEYIDLPDLAAERRDEQGRLYLWAGNIAVHTFRWDFLERVAAIDDALPFHFAHKAVPYLNELGELVKPSEPNATKFEKFIFDLMPLAHNAIAVEVSQHDQFAPVKNASGAASDTPESSRAAIVARAKRWLTSVGVEVVDGVQVEIHPSFALDVDELAKRVTTDKITADMFLS